MALTGWLLDTSAAAKAEDPAIGRQLDDLAGSLYVCPVGELEQLHSARSAAAYDVLREELHASFEIVVSPGDIFERALRLQQDLAHHRGMSHRTPISDLLVAETALHHALGVVHVDRHYERIAEVRPLQVKRLG